MKENYFNRLVIKQLLCVLCILFAFNNVAAQRFDNGKLRFGGVSSVNAKGTLVSPLYSTGSGYNSLIHPSLPALNYAFGIQGSGSNEWNHAGFGRIDNDLTNQTINYSQYIPTGGGSGYGTIISKGQLKINTSLLEIESTYTLKQISPVVEVKMKIKNIGGEPITNLRYWAGTVNDRMGAIDNPGKTKGNITSSGFMPITNASTRSNAIKIFSGTDAAIIFVDSNRANTLIKDSDSLWVTVYNEDPSTSIIHTENADNAYGFYIRLNDLAVGESDEFTWYYGAGDLDDILNNIPLPIAVPLDLTLVSKTDILCNGNTSGSAIVSATGGTPPYTYLWSPLGGTGSIATGLSAGYYAVTVTDAVGHVDSVNVDITEPFAPLDATLEYRSVFCPGATDIKAEIIVTGGTPPYTYRWNTIPEQTTAIATGLSDGNYSIQVIDANNCDFVLNTYISDEDTKKPTVITKDITVQLDYSGNVTISSAIVDNGSFDNCSPVTFSLDRTTFNCNDAGSPVIVTLRVTDASGNWAEKTAKVTVKDNWAPNISARGLIIVQLDATGHVTIDPAQIDKGSNDACGIADIKLSITDFDCNDIGNNSVFFTVTDVNGNSTSVPVTVKVQDTIFPTAIAQDIIIQLDGSGHAIIEAKDIDNGSGDNCADFILSVDKTTFDCSNIGSNTVIFTIKDKSGNQKTATAIVTVQDTVFPTVIAQDITLQLDVSGHAIIEVADIDNGSFDNCGPITLSLDKTTFDCSNIGANTVKLTVTDISGNVSTQTVIVTVLSNTNLNIVTKNITVQLDASGIATITPAMIDNGSDSSCGNVILLLDKTSFDCTNVGNNTVTLTVADVNGNSTTGTAIVTVEDTITPTIITQDIVVQLDTLGNAAITALQIDNGSFDNCNIATIILDKTSFDCTNVGANTITLTVTDVNGNSSTRVALVTVEDVIIPMAITQDIVVQLDAMGTAAITALQIDNSSFDNCNPVTLSLDKTSFDCTNVGVNTVILTVTDVNGNSSMGTAIVTVEDAIAPAAITQNITVQLDATGHVMINAGMVDDGSFDNCGDVTLLLDKTSFDCTNIGANTVTLTIIDVNGNSATGTTIVTVEDTIAPTAITQNITVQLDATGHTMINAGIVDDGSFDNCGPIALSLDKTSFDCTNVGPNTVTLTVTDINGNPSTGTAIVTVEDAIAPTVITHDIVVQLDAMGTAAITALQIDNSSFDNCNPVTLSLDKTSFDCTNVGVNTVILTVTDVNGNSSMGTAIVIVEDTIIPTVITQDIIVQLNAMGNATITPSQIDKGSFDNCTLDTIVLNKTVFDCTNVGPNTVTLTVTDLNGNSATETAIVTVEDTIAPTVITQDIIVQLDVAGNATITASQIDNGSFDNCGLITLSVDKTSFDCTNVGDNTVTFTVADVNGNSSSGMAVVTVQNNALPTVITQNIAVQLDATGHVTIDADMVDNGSFDSCSTVTLSLDKTTFDCNNIGANTVTLTVNVNGISVTGTAIVTVKDVLAPIISFKPATLTLDINGEAILTIADVDNGTTDNCAIQSVTLSKTLFNCNDIGTNKITITATDIHNNISKQDVTVTIIDSVAPIVITQNIEVSLTDNGTVIITPSMIDNGSTDCAIATMTLDVDTFDCSNIGANTVTLTIIDKSGNTSAATAIVTVLVPKPTFPNLTQKFCVADDPIIADLAVYETNVQWFADAVSTKILSPNKRITNGIYYAAIRYGNCYSDRVAVTVIINDSTAPTGEAVQYICKEEEHTIADLITNEEDVIWYETSTGGNPLSASTVLEHKQKYYASYVGSGCESSERFEVEVIIRYCDVIVHNAISANGDGKNDYFSIEGATTFSDSKLEIFNRWGSVVFETARYGLDNNLFKGFANTGLGSTGGLLPYGTYYYVFSFTNHDGSRITKKGFLHLNH